MNLEDQAKLAEMLEELSAIYKHTYNDALVQGYFRVLRAYSFAAVRQAAIRLMGDTERKQSMPLPSELKLLAVRLDFVRDAGSLEDERWRRQYDVWQRGRFSDDALEVSYKLTDAELGLDTIDSDEATYLHCQQPGCPSLLPWPSDRRDVRRMFCPVHAPGDMLPPVTAAEKRAILERSTPAAKSFLRSIDMLARHMTEIPITPEEQAITDADAVPLRARAFDEKAEGPGVNPSVYLTRPFITADLPTEYAERRQMLAAAGWRFDAQEGTWANGHRVVRQVPGTNGDGLVEKAVWVKGKRRLTEDRIDRFHDKQSLGEFLHRRER